MSPIVNKVRDEPTFEEGYDEPIDEEGRRRALQTLRERCVAAGVEHEVAESSLGTHLVVYLPAGPKKRRINVQWQDEAEELVRAGFERYEVLPGYAAVCSYSLGEIEAVLQQLGGRFMPDEALLQTKVTDTSLQYTPIVLQPSDGLHSKTITISYASFACLFMSQSGIYETERLGAPLSAKFSGLEISTWEQATEHLIKMADALLFQIDLTFGITLALQRERQHSGMRQTNSRPPSDTLQFPWSEYHHGSLELYRYAASARQMPLLQFLAFYQAIEVHFPAYSQIEAQKRVRQILKDPSFNLYRDTDIGRILAVMKGGGSRGFGDERTQLRATIQECVSSEGLRSFLTEDEDRLKYYSSKQKGVSNHRIRVLDQESDLRADVSERIYDIRCRIVHTKSTGESVELGQLLPFSQEASQLEQDIALVRYIAQQVIIASGTPFVGA